MKSIEDRLAALEARVGIARFAPPADAAPGDPFNQCRPEPAPEPERHPWVGPNREDLRPGRSGATWSLDGATEFNRMHREILALRRERDGAAHKERQRIADALERRAAREPHMRTRFEAYTTHKIANNIRLDNL